MKKQTAAALAAVLVAASAATATTPAPGYLYAREVLATTTEGCVASAPGGVYVGVGPTLAFPPPGGTRDILFVADGGSVRTVATGLNAIGDCAWDDAADLLYVSDSGAEFSGAASGDTVFAVPGDATAVAVAGLEVVPAGSIPFAFSVALSGTSLFVSDAAGGGAGSVVEIDLAAGPPSATTLASGFDYTGGVAVAGGSLFVAEALEPGFDAAIYEYTTGGAFVSTLSGPTYDHGSVDLAVTDGGDLLVTGLPTIASVDSGGTATALVTGLDGGTGFAAFGGSVTQDPFTGRIDFLASSFSGDADDRSVHRLIPIDRLVPGRGSKRKDCAMEFYGVELVEPEPGRRARSAICSDGAACDADGVADGVCTFPLGVCINVPDPRRPDCTPGTVEVLELKKSRPESAELAMLVADAAASLPTSEGTCFFGGDVRVPVETLSSGRLRAGRGRVAMRVKGSGPGASSDRDAIRFVCEP